ncbi:MAG TPA: ABC transporter permease [Gemmatimonadaceae bacterium]|nr:ABC transporter permease [Gemmatimonadaceae bacterium]
MSLWRQVTRGLGVLLNRSAADRALSDEMRHYMDETIAAHIARGLSPDDARRAAQLEVGNTTAIRDDVRSHGWEHFVDTFFTDVRYGARRLRNTPGLTAIGVLTLAIGIGASTAIFSALNPVLFEALPYPHADRLAMIWYSGGDGTRSDQSFGTYREVAARSRTFEAVAVYKAWQRTLTGRDEPEPLDGQLVSASFFRVLGVGPAIGAGFELADDRPNGARVVIISDRLWRRRFHADRSIVGSQVTLNDKPYTVVGVMPARFENVLAPTADLWSLLQYDPALPVDGREWGRHLRMVGRVRAGAAVAEARRELDEIARHPAADFARPPFASMANGLGVAGLQDELVRAVRPALLAMFGAALLVLAIACVNVTNLLLARTAQRRPEIALRLALGAGRMRLVRQLLTETVLLALAGGALGVMVAQAGVGALLTLSPAELPRAASIHVDAAAFAFASGIAMLVGIVVGIAPALHAVGQDARARAQLGSRWTVGGRGTMRGTMRGTLVVAEVALAIVLLVGAGLLVRSLQRVFAIAPGFDASHLLTMQVQVSSPRRYPDDAAFFRFYAEALDTVRRVNGVESAAFTSELPLAEDGRLETYGSTFENDNDRAEANAAVRYAITPSYFATLKIPLRRGRLFDEHDVTGAVPRPIVINESFARRKFPGLDPIGQRVRFGGSSTRPWDVIVGVVADVRQASLAERSDALYALENQWMWADNPMWLVVRARGTAAALAPAIRAAIYSVNSDQPVRRVATMEQLLAASEAKRRFALVVFEAFAVVALLLAALGIYGVLSGGVAERTREIGVRSALGAAPRDILVLVMHQGMRLALLGAVIGLMASIAATRALVTLIYGITRFDLVTYGGVVVLLAAVSLLACWVPAWRAARVDPAGALRQ